MNYDGFAGYDSRFLPTVPRAADGQAMRQCKPLSANEYIHLLIIHANFSAGAISKTGDSVDGGSTTPGRGSRETSFL